MTYANPYEIIDRRLSAIEQVLQDIRQQRNRQPTPADEYLTVEQVCKTFQISRTTVWQLRRDGKLTARTVGRKVLFLRSDVEKVVQPITA